MKDEMVHVVHYMYYRIKYERYAVAFTVHLDIHCPKVQDRPRPLL